MMCRMLLLRPRLQLVRVVPGNVPARQVFVEVRDRRRLADGLQAGPFPQLI